MKLLILDRDGVINADSDQYIKSPEEWQALPSSLEAIAKLCRNDYKIVVTTNQSGIARGLFNMSMLNKINNRMLTQVRQKGGDIAAVLFCPHGPDDGCQCRKPLPGMFTELAARMKTSLLGVPAVGDSLRDLQSARAVRAYPVLVRTGKGEQTLARRDQEWLAQVPVFDDLAHFADALLQGELDQRIAEFVDSCSETDD